MFQCFFEQHIWFNPVQGAPCCCGKRKYGERVPIEEPKRVANVVDWDKLKRQAEALKRRKKFYAIKGGKE